MNAKISTTIAKQQPRVANYLATRNGVSPKAVEANVTTLNAVMPNRDGEYVWDFEDADAGLSPFTAEDKDGDGFNWTYYNNTGLTSGRMTAHEGEGLIASASYDNDNYAVLTPNNWLVSPELTLGGALKFWAMGQDANYCSEVFGVYVTVDGETWTQVGTDKTATGEYVEYEYDLAPYAGQTGKFAIVHHNVTDMFFLNIDDITFNPSGVVTPEPTIPTDVAVTPTATTGEVTWVPGENNATWNLRWRPWTDPALMNRLWDFPLDGYEDQLEGWMSYDADGDGNGWGLAYSSDAQDDVCFYSASYANYTALTPDNWLFTPEVPLGGTLKFDAWQRSGSYPDKIMVYVCDNPEWESTDEFIAISEFIQPTGTDPESFELDLGAFEGMGVIAFRHYDCTDQWAIYIDNIAVEVPDAVEPAEWTLCENVENPYTIEGLTPETVYEVQVMAFNEEGDKSTDWTKSTLFTTLAEDVQEMGYYLVGTFNGWNQVEGMIEFVDNKAEGVALEAEAEFKVITFDETGATVWYGGEDANQVGYFLINEDLLGVNLTMCDGANFRIAEAGTYNFELVYDREEGVPMLKVTLAENVGISTIAADKADNRIFDLMGRELKSVPETGIYIQNGKKYVK